MEIFWLIISIVVGFFSLCVFLWTSSIKHGDKKYWDEYYKKLNENKSVEVPEEIAQKAVETIGEDRIRRYYFDIEE